MAESQTGGDVIQTVLRHCVLFLLLASVAFGWFRIRDGSLSKNDLLVRTIRVPNGGIQPQALTDRTGVIHLLYYSGDPAHGDLFYVKSADEGMTWTKPVRVNSEAGTAIALGTIRGGQIALGRNGRVYVAWNGSSESEADGPLNPESGKRGAPMLCTRLNDDHTRFGA